MIVYLSALRSSLTKLLSYYAGAISIQVTIAMMNQILANSNLFLVLLKNDSNDLVE